MTARWIAVMTAAGIALGGGATLAQTRGTTPPGLDARANPPVRITGPLPVYPQEARGNHLGGVVTVNVTVSPEGKVTDTKTVRSIPALDAAAADAVRVWTFRPNGALLNGAPTSVTFPAVFYFDPDSGQVEEVQRIRRGTPEPKRIKNVPPAWPQRAGRGQVVSDIVVSKFGKVIDLRVVSAGPGLEGAAREAIKQWEYEPLLVNGRPTPFLMTVTVIFNGRG